MIWLNKNVRYQKNNVLKLTDLLVSYLNQDNIYPRQASIYKATIENFIKNKFPNINHEYQNSSFYSIKYKYWRVLVLIKP